MQSSSEPVLEKDVKIRSFNTFRVDAIASEFVTVSSAEQLQVLFQKGLLQRRKICVLGGGSNILFTGPVDQLILKNEISGKDIHEDSGGFIRVQVGAGVDWHTFVTWCVEQDLGGIENLALIPGTVGAAPIQNIGAYGVELSDVFDSLVAFDLESGTFRTFLKEECDFAYRNSIFKQEYKHRFIITSVTVRLSQSPHRVHMDYASLKEWIHKEEIESPTIYDVYRGVISIRRSKLPDPIKLGNAGSFFKNPVISLDKLEVLKKEFPSLPSYAEGVDTYKVPAGWLIERAGWKGKRIGDVGTFEKQALVIVNYGQATGNDILSFAGRIRTSVKEIFDIDLEPEVNIVGEAGSQK